MYFKLPLIHSGSCHVVKEFYFVFIVRQVVPIQYKAEANLHLFLRESVLNYGRLL